MASLSGQTLQNPYRSYYLSNPVDVLTFTGVPELEFSNVGGKIVGINGNGDALSTSVWSDYPTLSNTITFDASNALTVVGSNLYFNSNLLAQAGQISNVADWYLYPALSGNVLLNAGVGISFNGITLTRSNTDLIWNGGSVLPSTWSAYPATQNVGMAGNNLVSGTGSNIGVLASNTATVQGANATLTATTSNPAIVPTLDAQASGGLGGRVNITASSANSGINTGGSVYITANGGSNGPFVFGGLIELDANTGGYGEYGAATSAIKLSAAGINLYAGAIPSVGSVAGYLFNYGMLGVNTCVGLPSVLPNFPGTAYTYATGGVGYGGIRFESPAGVECVNSTDFYAFRIYPYYNSFLVGTHPDLLISGRSNVVGNNQYLKLAMCAQIDMASNAAINNVSALSLNTGTISGVSNITMTGAGSLCNVVSINGAAYPPASTPPSNWANYPAVSNVDVSNFLIQKTTDVKFTQGAFSALVGAKPAVGYQGGGTAVAAYDYTNNIFADIRTDNIVFSEAGSGPANDIWLTSLYAPGSSQKSRFNVFWSDSIGNPKSDTVAYLSDVYFRPSYDIYVAPNGSDTTGDGSESNPYATIVKALTVRATLGAGPFNINLAAGTYTENPTLSTAGTYLVGVGGTADPATDATTVVGTITCSATNTGLNGMSITGTVAASGTTNNISLSNLTITSASGFSVGGAAIVSMTLCRITNSGGGCVNINSGGVYTINRCDLTQTGVANVMGVGGSVSTSYSTYTSTSAANNPAALVRFFNTFPSTMTMMFCRLNYTSTTTDVGGNKCCVQFNGSATATASMAYVQLDCVGAQTGSPNIQCIQDPGAGATNLTYGDLQAISPAQHIAPSITKTSMFTVA